MIEATQTVDVAEKAHMAWAEHALRESEVATAALRRKLAKRLSIFEGDLEVSPDYFDAEVSPWMRVAVERDGLTFCFTQGRHLAVVAWRCGKYGKDDCQRVSRVPFLDYPSLGAALAEGALNPETCGQH